MPDLNLDLKPSSTNPGLLTPDWVWTLCELVIYRLRDRQLDSGDRALLSMAADDIRDLRRAWKGKQ